MRNAYRLHSYCASVELHPRPEQRMLPAYYNQFSCDGSQTNARKQIKFDHVLYSSSRALELSDSSAPGSLDTVLNPLLSERPFTRGHVSGGNVGDTAFHNTVRLPVTE